MNARTRRGEKRTKREELTMSSVELDDLVNVVELGGFRSKAAAIRRGLKELSKLVEAGEVSAHPDD